MKPVRVWPKTGVDRSAGKPEGQSKRRTRVGVYKEEGAERCLELKAEGQGLRCTTFLNTFLLKSDRPGGYAGQGSGAIFRLDFDAQGLRLLRQGKASPYKRLKPLKITPGRVKPLLGSWSCPESGAETRFSASKGKLWQHSLAWTDEVLCWAPGSYYVDQLLYRVKNGRLTMGCDDGWISGVEWVRKSRRA